MLRPDHKVDRKCPNDGQDSDFYSRLQHLVSALRPSHDPGVLKVAALTAYFDASGTEHSGTELVVSGFISTVP